LVSIRDTSAWEQSQARGHHDKVPVYNQNVPEVERSISTLFYPGRFLRNLVCALALLRRCKPQLSLSVGLCTLQGNIHLAQSAFWPRYLFSRGYRKPERCPCALSFRPPCMTGRASKGVFVRTRVSRKADHMQQTLWGDKERPQFTRRHTSRTTLPTVVHTTSDGPIYGHNLQTVGMLGEKRCTACSIQGYCQGCISNPPANAQPFYCTRHTPPTESQVSA
jgi:hypothetical protein